MAMEGSYIEALRNDHGMRVNDPVAGAMMNPHNGGLTNRPTPLEGVDGSALPHFRAETVRSEAPSFGDLLENLIQSVDEKSKVSASEVSKVLSGESDNVHRAMIAMQESGVAFSLMVEVRNQLVSAYQELLRIQ